jgi:hypothetical protein
MKESRLHRHGLEAGRNANRDKYNAYNGALKTP